MLHYLGDHILMLTSMNLRDYLRLKVEIQGTSGEGSKAVKAFRSSTQLVLNSLTRAVLLCIFEKLNTGSFASEQLCDFTTFISVYLCLSTFTQCM